MYGISMDMAAWCETTASGTKRPCPIRSTEPSAMTALPSHATASRRAGGRRQATARPSSASSVSIAPKVGMPSLWVW